VTARSTLRDFIRALCLSDTFTLSFLQPQQQLQGPATWLRSCWPAGVRQARDACVAVIMTKASPAPSTRFLSSQDTSRTLATTRSLHPQPCGSGPARWAKNPLAIYHTPRYDAYHRGGRGDLASQHLHTNGPQPATPRAKANAVGGFPRLPGPGFAACRPCAPARRPRQCRHGLPLQGPLPQASGADAQIALRASSSLGFTAVHHRRFFVSWHTGLGVSGC